ncbi:MAG TPA: response regulator [Alphaproteobacteria bacterium]|nr:response regulator [Alphaproteobacteria bacterium]
MARILIVEDDPLFATSMSELLEGAGHTVLGIADTGASALQQAARHQPDLALVDIKLKNKGDGVRTALRLKARHSLKVVFVSGYLDSRTQKRAAEVEPAGFVTKPCSAQDLLKIVFVATAESSVS